jgi:hypothetical protein
MFFSTLLTLVIVPVVYTLLARYTKAEKLAEDQSLQENTDVAPPSMSDPALERTSTAK